MQTLQLHNDTWDLTLMPAWGGRIGALKTGGLDILTPIHVEGFDPLNWPRGGAYPLMPYSNRLRNARLDHTGTVHTLPAHPAAQPHSLHGVSHTLAWDVLAQSAGHVLLACHYIGPHWPWPVRFQQHYDLIGQQLRIRLSVSNLGKSSMPAGLGLHPYFQRHPGMTARLRVGKDWELDEDYLPTGTAHGMDETLVIPAHVDHEVTLYGSGWDGLVHLDYPAGHLLMQADSSLTHVVAFAPAGAPYLCLEPVSHLADAFNTDPAQWPEQGTQVLEPGQTLTAQVSFTWTPV